MALRFKINGVDFTTKWRPYESSWTQRAWQGESSQSRFILDDDDGTINHATLAARKIVTVEEDASGSWVTLYRGRMMSHSVARGTIIAGVAARWTLTTEDSNIDARTASASWRTWRATSTGPARRTRTPATRPTLTARTSKSLTS
jgi:hypothetical protein